MLTILAEAGAEAPKAWYEYVNGGGDFFSHFVFTLLASVVLSSKWRDYLIVPRKDDMEEFHQEVSEEIDKVKLSARLDPRLKADIQNKYECFKEDTKNLIKELESLTSGTTWWCKLWCWVCLIATVIFIATGLDKMLGFLCILCLWPIPVFRKIINNKHGEIQGRHEQLKNNYKSVQEVCQRQYDDKLKTEDDKFRSFSNARRVSIRRTAE
ncbi:MAG: hypothetical protein UHH87_05195 [Akkermansia sp.]|nr:hypothetical protein [Akkermansia sp.]